MEMALCIKGGRPCRYPAGAARGEAVVIRENRKAEVAIYM
jgi:hypothetical protein